MTISSRNVVEGTARAPHRAMYKAMGLTDDDLSKSFIGVCHTGNEATPCNIHLPALAQKAKDGVNDGVKDGFRDGVRMVFKMMVEIIGDSFRDGIVLEIVSMRL